MKNVGKSPALNVEVWVKLTTENKLRELEREQISFANEIRGDPKSLSIAVFPNQTERFEVIGAIKTADVKAQLAHQGVPWVLGAHVSIYVLGCIDYYSEIGKRTHQTGFIFMIGIRSFGTNELILQDFPRRSRGMR